MSLQRDAAREAPDEEFIRQLTAVQLQLLHYIAKLLGNPDEAQNVLQETNLVLWRKANEFEPGSNFTAWAHQVAYWQVQAYVRDRRRDRHVFDPELVEQLTRPEVQVDATAELRVALRHCLDEISPKSLQLLKKRYEGGISVNELASSLQKKPTAVRVGLLRIRRALLKCIQHRVGSS
jgi:RNA polymerase sigma-70 factor (ECF subfamily)